MKNTIFSLALSALCFLTQLAVAQSGETQNVGDFTEVRIGGGYEVMMTKGNATTVKLEGDQDDLEKIEVSNEGGVLKIANKQKNGWGWSRMGRVKVYITFKELNKLTSSGSSSIDVKSELKTSSFTYKGSGSGNTYLYLDVKELEASITGSGTVNFKGNAEQEHFTVTGSGDIKAMDMKASKANVKVTGSGDIKLHVTDALNAKLTGSGSIRYKGDPTQDVKITGSGSVKKY